MKTKSSKYILWFKEISKNDVPLVGGKNASLGEMYSKLTKKGIDVPDGFALTTNFYWGFLKANRLDKKLLEFFQEFDPQSIKSIQETGKKCRDAISKGEFSDGLKQEVLKAYLKLSQKYGKDPDVAVRTSGVAEDRPNASFAGQFETYLNVKGEEGLLKAVKKSIISTFTDRAIAYREEKKIGQMEFGLSVGVQKMVRSDLASSGIIFTLDTETGFDKVISINSIWGVGEMIVKGKITPDQFYVFKPLLQFTASSLRAAQGKLYKPIIVKNLGRKNKKYIFAKAGGLKEVEVLSSQQLKFSLTDEEILKLARWAQIIEKHYKIAQDIEWAKDGKTGQLFVVQSRPETVHTQNKKSFYETYEIKTHKKPVLTGMAIGEKMGMGQAKIIDDVSEISKFKKGDVLITKMTDPDWMPAVRIASAVITDEGGPTCHAAIVARELGIPAIVGTVKGTKVLKEGQQVTVDCTQGRQGRIFLGRIPFAIKQYNLKKIPSLKTKIMVNIGTPEIAFKSSFLPAGGVGLAREEFIIAEKIKIHPLALYNFKNLKNKKLKREIERMTVEHKDKKEYFVKELAEGIAQIAAAFYPKEVIVRFSDFKTNEYKNLIGGELFEGEEENPMLGFRGAARYLDKNFQPAFEMECQSIKRARDVFGLENIKVMIPFCRTVQEGEKVLELMKKCGLERGKNNLEVLAMCEVPSNVVLVDEFSRIFDGYSIGSNDLTQLLLGVDRDNAKLSEVFDENNEAVRIMIKEFIKKAHRQKKKVGICGEAPANSFEFLKFLIECKIDSISVNPESVLKTIILASKIENSLK